MVVDGNITDEVYQKLIEYACKKCDVVRFITRNDGFDESDKRKLNNLEMNILKEFNESFLCYKTNIDWLRVNNFSTNSYYIYHLYNLSEDIKQYLLTNKNLYTWLNPKYPEDISFFKDGYCWLYSVAHEGICNIYCENEEEYNYLKSIGIEFVEDKFIPTLKEDLYYEKY